MLLTPENRNRLRATVFGKTAAGRAEVEQRQAGLTARQRAVLILLDGRRATGEIDSWLAEDDLLAAIEALLRLGLVRIESAPAPLPAAMPAPQPAPVPASVMHAKALMAAAARTHLGLMAADLLRRIELAADSGQLAAVLGLWHVSLRESKTGKQCAQGLLDEARALLG